MYDLALEAAEQLTARGGAPGVKCREETRGGVQVTVVDIETPQGARAAGKPVGRYVTLNLGPAQRREKAGFGRCVHALAGELRRLLPAEGEALVVCLGNRDVTPDALGPLVHDKLLVTRHLTRHAPEQFGGFRPVAALSPGVLGATGVESGDLAAAVTDKIRPSCVIAVDALATGSVKRLCATVQLSDTGISPGSGVGNHRQALTGETLGVPVIALGVPTVVDAAALACELLRETGGDPDPAALQRGERLFVTPRDIDVQVASCAKVAAYAISLALQPRLTLEDLELLLE